LTRPTPKEDAVISELKQRDDNSSDDGGTDAVVESAAPEVDELTKVTRERDEYLDLAKRTQADFENYRKRAAKDMTAAGARARIGVIREILPVIDNLERALSVAPDGDGDPFVEGVRLVYRELEGALARAGVEVIEPKGETFDPNVHEALSMHPQEGAESGTVVDVVEKGYRTADSVIRPARVVVAS
jgi:molecular chaperone GrpE